MGDHRASIKIEMEFHGIKDKCDMWINYFPEYGGMDKRVIDFFESVYERGMAVYEDLVEKHYQEEHKKEIEDKEKAELKRLEDKYNKKGAN